MTLAEVDGGTRVVARHAGLVVDQGEVRGWTESLDRLAQLLATPQPRADRAAPAADSTTPDGSDSR